MAKKFKRYYAAVNYIESLSNIKLKKYESIEASLIEKNKRFVFFMNRLGNPHLHLKYIHITGSSGKGSVATMIHSILVECGYKTGLFLSPHTTAKIDRIRINNSFISPDSFADILERIKPVIEEMKNDKNIGRPTHFQVCLAIAFLYFAQKKCDYVVLEVGCGGKLDATNIIPTPIAAIINLVDYDHEKILGHTLTAIAKAKAGIIKPNTALFTTYRNKPLVLNILKKECQKKKAKFNLVKTSKKHYQLSMAGEHQQDNASLAAAVARFLKIPEDAINQGLKKAKLPCRFEIIQKKPLVIIDGAHNSSKMKTTLASLADLTYSRLFLIIALSHSKEPNSIFNDIIRKADKVYITCHQNHFHHCFNPNQLKKELSVAKQSQKILTISNPQTALEQALKQAKEDDAILITGSLYLAGELRKHWIPEKVILKKRKA